MQEWYLGWEMSGLERCPHSSVQECPHTEIEVPL